MLPKGLIASDHEAMWMPLVCSLCVAQTIAVKAGHLVDPGNAADLDPMSLDQVSAAPSAALKTQFAPLLTISELNATAQLHIACSAGRCLAKQVA